MVMGWDDALILGAISAGTTAYASHQSNNANMGINAMNATQAADFFRDSQDYNTWMGREQRAYNSNEAQLARDFSRDMEKTKWQRAVGDMQAAGINPMLSVSQGAGGAGQAVAASSGGGAGGPSGSVPSMIPMRSVGGDAAQSALQVVQASKESKLMDAQVENVQADTDAKRATVPQSLAHAQKMEQEVKNLVEEIPRIKALVENTKADTFNKDIQSNLYTALHNLALEDVKYRAGQTSLVNLQTEKAKVEKLLLDLSVPAAKSEAGFYGSDYGEEAHPWMKRGLEGLKGLGHLWNRR